MPTRTSILLTCMLLLTLTACQPGMQSSPSFTPTTQPATVTPLANLPDTWTPQPTFTPSPTSPTPLPHSPTPSQTISTLKITSSLPAMTPVRVTHAPQVEIPAEWQRVEAETISFRLPPYLEVMDLGSGMGELFQLFIQGFAEGFSDVAEELGQEFGATPQSTPDLSQLDDLPAFDLVMALDETQLVAMMMTGEEMEEPVSLEESLNEALSNVDTDFELLRKEIVDNAPQPTARVFLTVDDEEEGKGKQVLYVIQEGDMRWTFYFASALETFPDYKPDFEAVIDSVAINP